ncbi:MAG: hypothetical protein QUS11_09525 [Candidatus Fermentibacter sp.]|nr:hypothetical protein [Candidatus Fermentibacter sp.]
MAALEQLFCEVCSRGVILGRESVYKCAVCGKIVCRDCFHTPQKQCDECFAAFLEEQRRVRLVEDVESHRLEEEERLRERAENRRLVIGRQRRSALVWMVAVPLVFTLFCWLVLGLLLRTPHGFWVTLAVVHDFIFVMAGCARYPWREDLVDRISKSDRR